MQQISLAKRTTLYLFRIHRLRFIVHRLSSIFLYLLFFHLFSSNPLLSQNYYPVKINQKWGLMDINGALVVSPKYEVIGTPQKFGYTLMQQAGKIGLLNKKGQLLLPAKYEEIKILDSNFISVIFNQAQQVLTANGTIVLKGKEYKDFKVLNRELLSFTKNDLVGCVNTKGAIIVEPSYDGITLYKNQYLKIEKRKQYGLVDLTGKSILPIVADAFNILENGLIFYLKGVLWGAVTLEGKALIPPNYSGYELINSSLIKLERFGENWLFNIPEQKIVSTKSASHFLAFSDKYVLTRLGDKFGLVDYRAREILANKYQEIQSF